jgi:Matrixin
VRTLALPTLPVKHARTLAYGLALACTTLAPLPSDAFTYETQAGPVVIQHQSLGPPLVWPALPIRIRLELGGAWDDHAATALAAWNAVAPLFVQHSTAPTVIRWAQPAAGEVLGLQVAQTSKDYVTRSGTLVVTRATVLLNPALCWDAYAGPLRSTLCQGHWEPLLDIQRVILHELGHVAGLAHPDDGGQVVSAIMNQSVSDLDELTPDDEAGLHFLYPAGAPAPRVTPQAISQVRQGSGGGGGGCTMGPGASPDLLLGVLVPLVVVVETLRHGARGAALPRGSHASRPMGARLCRTTV